MCRGCSITAIILPNEAKVYNRFVSIFPSKFDNNNGMCCKKKKIAPAKNSFLASWVELFVKMMSQLCKENQHLRVSFLPVTAVHPAQVEADKNV